MKNCLHFLSFLFLIVNVTFGQTNPNPVKKPSPQKEMDAATKEMQKAMDAMSPEEKKKLESMGVNVHATFDLPNSSDKQWEDADLFGRRIENLFENY